MNIISLIASCSQISTRFVLTRYVVTWRHRNDFQKGSLYSQVPRNRRHSRSCRVTQGRTRAGLETERIEESMTQSLCLHGKECVIQGRYAESVLGLESLKHFCGLGVVGRSLIWYLPQIEGRGLWCDVRI